MKRVICLALVLACLLLAGCHELNMGSHQSVTPHKEEDAWVDPEDVSAATYLQLRSAVADLVEAGAAAGLIYVSEYDQNELESDIDRAVQYAMTENPIGAYAVEQITYELGSSGKTAVALEISYLHDGSEIRRIKQYDTVEQAWEAVTAALDECQSSLVLQISRYEQTDFVQLVQDYAEEYPQNVMEVPDVSVGIYPEEGSERVVELKFTYQTSRESLRSMQNQVQPVFASAKLYVSGDGEDREKLSQLYSFLMERFDYKIETSITPSYSLLRHGVGDCKAFALVYSAICREAGLECLMVSGTRDGEAWYWNIVRDGEQYYHVDLLDCAARGGFYTREDVEMAGYVWDYSAYPACAAEEETTESAETVDE